MRSKLPRVVRNPLYRQVMDGIRDLLGERNPGDRLQTEAEFVRHFDVSLATVRQALMGLEREGLIERRQGSGTFVVDRHMSGKHVAVLLDVDIASDNLSPFYPKLLRAMQEALTAANIPNRPYLGRLPLGTHPTENITCQDLLDDAKIGRIKGIIGFFVGKSPSWATQFQKVGIPTLDSDLHHLEMLRDFAESSLSYFRERGRKRIAVIGWESPIDGRREMTNLLPELASKFGIDFDSRLFDLDVNGWERGMAWERFRDIWRSSREKPDGLMVLNDMLYPDCVKAIRDLRIEIPTAMDVALATSDAMNLNYEFPLFEWKLVLGDYVEMFTAAMEAVLAGKEIPQLQKHHWVTKMAGEESLSTENEPASVYNSPSMNL